jgi:hypothetical protein
MFSRFRGKSDKAVPPRDAVDSRGLEVIEDDPDTAWSLWDSALAAQDSRFSGMAPLAPAPEPLPTLPEINAKALHQPDFDDATKPMELEDKSPSQRMADALLIVELYHQRIANTIRTMWGYKECSMYINKLIMNGGDGMGNARIGFNQEAADAMMVLADLHDQLFGPSDAGNTGFGFSDSSFTAGYDGHR